MKTWAVEILVFLQALIILIGLYWSTWLCVYLWNSISVSECSWGISLNVCLCMSLVCLSVRLCMCPACLSIHRSFVYVLVCLFVYTSPNVCLSWITGVWLFASLSVSVCLLGLPVGPCLPINLSLFVSLYAICFSVRPSVCLSVNLSVCPPVFLSVCPSVALSFLWIQCLCRCHSQHHSSGLSLDMFAWMDATQRDEWRQRPRYIPLPFTSNPSANDFISGPQHLPLVNRTPGNPNCVRNVSLHLIPSWS